MADSEITNGDSEMTYVIEYLPDFKGYLHYARLGNKCWQQLMQTGAPSDIFIRNASGALNARKTN